MDEQNKDSKEHLIELLENRCKYYDTQNANMLILFKKLQLVDEDGNLIGHSKDLIETIGEIKDKFDVDNFSTNSLVLSYANELRNQNNYTWKMKIYIKHFMNFNSKLSKIMDTMKHSFKTAQDKISSNQISSTDELKAFQKKIERYQSELTKFEQKNPWMEDSNLNLIKISKEINVLTELQNDQEKIIKELSCYHNLSPNLQEAMEQLNELKIEHQKLSNDLLDIRNNYD